jgi:hypothetical protein
MQIPKRCNEIYRCNQNGLSAWQFVVDSESEEIICLLKKIKNK